MYSQSGLKRLNSSGFVFHVIKWNLWEWLDFPAKGRMWKTKKKHVKTCYYASSNCRRSHFDCKMAKYWQCNHCGWSRNRLQNKCSLIALNLSVILCIRTRNLLVFIFWKAHTSSRCVCGRRISRCCLQRFVAPVISQHRVIDYSDHGTDCFTQISL